MTSKRLIITIHGIRTYGQWQERLEHAFSSQSISDGVEWRHYRYGFFSSLEFIVPFLRWIQVVRFSRHLRSELARHPWDRVDIVAHSFGTHLVGWALHRIELPCKIHKVILAGSVLPSSFPWSELVGTKVKQVVNECGTEDGVLVLNQAFVALTGMAGRVGFKTCSPLVINRYHSVSHSGYFENSFGAPENSFIKTYWLPLLQEGTEQDVESCSYRIPLRPRILMNLNPLKHALYCFCILLCFEWFQGFIAASMDAHAVAQLNDAGIRVIETPSQYELFFDDGIDAVSSAAYESVRPSLSKHVYTTLDDFDQKQFETFCSLDCDGPDQVYLRKYRGATISPLSKTKNIKLVTLDGCNGITTLSGIGPESITMLDVTECPNLHDVKALHGLPNLTTLHIAHSQNLEEESLRDLVQIHNLEFNCDIPKFCDIRGFKNLPDLKYLRFYACCVAWDERAVKIFQQAIKNESQAPVDTGFVSSLKGLERCTLYWAIMLNLNQAMLAPRLEVVEFAGFCPNSERLGQLRSINPKINFIVSDCRQSKEDAETNPVN